MGKKSHFSDINQIWFDMKKVCLLLKDFVIGLATFNGRNVLNDNGFRNVTVLMTSNDLTMCIKYQSYVNQDGLRQKVVSKKCAPRRRTLSHHGLRPSRSKNVPLVGGLCHVPGFWSGVIRHVPQFKTNNNHVRKEGRLLVSAVWKVSITFWRPT